MKSTKCILAVLSIVTLLMVSLPSGGFADDTIKIGEIQTYSKLTNFTFPYRNGWQLALEEINNAGGVMGKKLEVIFPRRCRQTRNCRNGRRRINSQRQGRSAHGHLFFSRGSRRD